MKLVWKDSYRNDWMLTIDVWSKGEEEAEEEDWGWKWGYKLHCDGTIKHEGVITGQRDMMPSLQHCLSDYQNMVTTCLLYSGGAKVEKEQLCHWCERPSEDKFCSVSCEYAYKYEYKAEIDKQLKSHEGHMDRMRQSGT